MTRFLRRAALAASICAAVAACGVDGLYHAPLAALTQEGEEAAGLGAFDDAAATLAVEGIATAWRVDDATARRLADAGLDLEGVRAALSSFVAGVAPSKPPTLPDRRLRAAEVLCALLARSGDEIDLPLLWQVETRGVSYHAPQARVRILERAMASAVANTPCQPPTAQEVARTRATLSDFLVIESDDRDQLRARLPTARELDDLAYLLAARGQAPPDLPRRRTPRTPTIAGELERAADEHDAAAQVGALEQAAASAQSYLELVGFPGAIDHELDPTFEWRGPRTAAMMDALAELCEGLGCFDTAAELYRRPLTPAASCCSSSRWQQRVRGRIRASERAGRCRDVVGERLLDIDGSWGDRLYGPTRLADAGFDVLRLLRGALVTINRDAPLPALRRAMATAPLDHATRQDALDRLARRGPEALERQLFALEGLADLAQRAALPTLLATAHIARASTAARAVDAIGALARRPYADPCDPQMGFGGLSISSRWSRPIHDLGRQCATHLDERARERLVHALLPLLASNRHQVRSSAAWALGVIADPTALADLRPLLADPYREPGVTLCTVSRPGAGPDTCRPSFPVRMAAREAIERIASYAREARADGAP